MGIKIMVEILDHWADVGLTRGERDDLIVIAENANEVSRETFHGIYHDYIYKRAGKQHAAWKNAVGALMKKGVLEYARRGGVEMTGHRGQVAVYYIPPLCPQPPHDGHLGQCTRPKRVIPEVTLPEKKGHPADDPTVGKGHPADDERVIPQMTPPPLSPLKNSPLSSPRDCIRRFVRLPDREEEELEQAITKTHAPRGLGWWRALADNGDLEVIIKAARAQRTPTPSRYSPSAPAEKDPMPEPPPEYRAARRARTARRAEPSRPGYEAAQAVLDALPYEEAATWRKEARAQLQGMQQADDRAVTILAAQLATADTIR